MSVLGLGNDPFPAHEVAMFRDNSARLRPKFVLDSRFGIRPPAGSGANDPYTPEGIYRGAGPGGEEPPAYRLEKTPGRERILFAGDSVTRRGRIIGALRRLHGDGAAEYLNAGVETFNTEQELLWYRTYNRALRPDQVILTFHPNDFEATPAAFIDEAGRLRVYSPQAGSWNPSRRLFASSRLYRLWLGWRLGGGGNPAGTERAAKALEGFANLSKEDGFRLDVLLLPPLVPETEWTESDRKARADFLAVAGRLGLNTYDLAEPLREALAAGTEVRETPGDPWHPSDGFAEAAARHLVERGLFGDGPETP